MLAATGTSREAVSERIIFAKNGYIVTYGNLCNSSLRIRISPVILH